MTGAGAIDAVLKDARYVVRVANGQVADVGVYPAGLVSQVEVNRNTSCVTDAVAQTVCQRLELDHVDAVD